MTGAPAACNPYRAGFPCLIGRAREENPAYAGILRVSTELHKNRLHRRAAGLRPAATCTKPAFASPLAERYKR